MDTHSALLTVNLGLNIAMLLVISFNAGKWVQRVSNLEKQRLEDKKELAKDINGIGKKVDDHIRQGHRFQKTSEATSEK